MTQPRVISTFSGCGGSSLGYKRAGFNVIAAIDNNPNACDVYELNHPTTKLYRKPIDKVDTSQLMRELDIEPGELELFDGSPPCQGFSVNGQRRLSDPRNQLFNEYARFVNDLKPKTFILENVPGMVSGKMKLIYRDIIRTLTGLGYRIATQLIDAQYLQVPQTRKRAIIVGVRTDQPNEPAHPKPILPVITIREAWDGITNKTYMQTRDGPAKWKELWEKTKPGNSFDKVIPGRSWFTHIRLSWDKPSPTIVHGSTSLYHPDECRVLTIEEAKRIGSFPDEFAFIGSFNEQWQRIGNSVPPNLMMHVAMAVKQEMGW